MIQNIDPLALPSLSLQERRNLPQCAAIYFVLNGSSEILYIGATVNLVQRWLAHHRWNQLTSMGDNIRIAWLECSDPVLLPEIEAALIENFHPALNRDRQVKGGAPNYKKEGIKTKRIGVVLPEDVGLRLEQIAKDKAWSISQTAAIAIEEWLEQQKVSINKEDAA